MGMLTVNNSTLSSRPWKQGLDYWSSFELYPKWKGKQYYIFKGSAYHQYEYATQVEVVVKTPKHTDAGQEYWQHYISSASEAMKMAKLFNDKLTSLGCEIKIIFVTPSTSVMDEISNFMVLTRFFKNFTKRFSKNEVVVFEDHLDGVFRTFVTETGHARHNGTGILDAYCHFSYQQSGGKMVVTNLKGVQEDNKYYFTNPVIHSIDARFGSNDQGEAGIAEFFKNHMCTGICSGFSKPCAPVVELPSAPPSYEETMMATKRNGIALTYGNSQLNHELSYMATT